MKLILVILFSIFISTGAMASNLTVKIKGFKNYRGSVQVALWDSPTGFPDDYNSAYITRTENTVQSFSIQIKDLKPGTYAVAMYHDKNNNTKLDTNFLGIPKEGFGFSNNPLIVAGPPSFGKVKFTIKEGQDKVITIKLKHFL